MTPQDERFMAAALRLGRRHQGQTSTNPSVATLIVQGEGDNAVIVGRGITGINGWPHAETPALEEAGQHAAGATAYVTLEPCAHHGRTPPCCDALIAAKIARVVIPILDPNPLTAGKGAATLRAAGIEVTQGVCAGQATRDHAGHIFRVFEQRPFVQLKMALTKDGIAGRAGERLMVTGKDAQVFSQRIRTQCDAIAVGIGTALADDPLLTCRLSGLEHRSPRRFIFDRRLRVDVTSNLITTAKDVPLIILTDENAVPEKMSALEKSGVQVERIADEEGVFIRNALQRMSQLGVTCLLLEGGPTLAGAFLQQDLIDQTSLVESSKSYEGKDGIAGLTPEDYQRITATGDFELADDVKSGEDRLRIFWRTRPCLQG